MLRLAVNDGFQRL